MTEATTKAPITGTVDYNETLGWTGTGVKLATDTRDAADLLARIAEATDGQIVAEKDFAQWGITDELPEATHVVLTYPSQVNFLSELIANSFKADGTVKPEVNQPNLEA